MYIVIKKDRDKEILLASVIIFLVIIADFWHLIAYDTNVLTAQASIRSYVARSKVKAQAVGRAGIPVRIVIPDISVDTVVERVALASDGAMGVPKYAVNTGWYERGPRPGELGSAVIDGHVDWINGASAVFKDLHKLQKGNTIAVQDDRGVVTNFLVTKIAVYNAQDDATAVFNSNDGKSHLNLITCMGTWDKGAKQYTKRLVVFTEKVF